MKFIITCQLPSGSRWAWAYVEQNGVKHFALAPINSGVARGVNAWDTREEAQEHLDEQLRLAPDLEKLGPFEIEQIEDLSSSLN